MRLAVLFFWLLFVAAGCSTPIAPRVVESVSEAPGTQPVVFGKVDVLSDKAPAEWTETDCTTDIYWTCPDSFRLMILKAGDPEPITYRLTGDGFFAFNLDPGRYFLAEWQWYQEGMTLQEHLGGPIRASFEVSEGSSATYLGHLTIAFRGARYAVDLEDRFAEAVSVLESRHVTRAMHPQKSVLALQRLPDGDKVVSVCDPGWGARCDDDFQGVEPTMPLQEGSDFPVVAELAPTLSWKAVETHDVTYDVVVYEAIPYGIPPFTKYVQGELVEYVRGLSDTSLKLEKELQPKSTYFWTVRLRRANVVSDWSSMSFGKIGFFIVAIVSEKGTNVLFRFKTP